MWDVWAVPETASTALVWLWASAAAECVTLGLMCGPWPVEKVSHFRHLDHAERSEDETPPLSVA